MRRNGPLVLFGNEIKHLETTTEARSLRFPFKSKHLRLALHVMPQACQRMYRERSSSRLSWASRPST